MANQIGARTYRECSALQNSGVDELFEAATRAAMLVRGPGAGGEDSHHHAGGEKAERRRSANGGKKVQGEDESGGCCGCVIL